MENAKKEFKKFIVQKLGGLPLERKMWVVESFMEVFKEAFEEAGIDLEIDITAVTKEKKEPKGFNNLAEFMEMLRENGVDLSKEKERKLEGDDTEKKIGDSVVVTDRKAAYYMHDFDTKEQLCKNYEEPLENFIGTPGIVTEIGKDFKFNCGHCEKTHSSDAVVYFPSVEKRYHVKSNLLKLL